MDAQGKTSPAGTSGRHKEVDHAGATSNGALTKEQEHGSGPRGEFGSTGASSFTVQQADGRYLSGRVASFRDPLWVTEPADAHTVPNEEEARSLASYFTTYAGVVCKPKRLP